MGQPLASPYSYFADANGAPLAGGLIYTYTAGTTTPQATYTDANLNIPLSNPVVLDAAGRAIIWLSGFYKIVVKDASGNLISTTDNITASGNGGDMQASVYDPGSIQEQLVGINAAQTLSNKILNIPDIVGVTNGSNANTGSVGEILESTVLVGAAVSLTSNVAANITTIALTPGDWDIWGNIALSPGGSTTYNSVSGWINIVSATAPTIPGQGAYFIHNNTFTTGAGAVFPVGVIRLNPSNSTNLYLSTRIVFAASTMAAYGYLAARRRR